ncbi:hypothetical protein [Paraburkholderia youngii]|uniref:hypothetical protein n=1 Tax=Paraburkholderia youngii TaxID=2782701 RepID=UPI003D241AF3
MPTTLMAFVAHDPATGRPIEQVPDHPDFQDIVGKVVVAWMRSGAKVLYVTADPTLVRMAPEWIALERTNEVLADHA